MDAVPEPRIQIVPMSAETVEEVAQIERRSFSSPWSLDMLAEELSNPMAVYYTAVEDGTVLGYAGLHHIIDEGYITNIAVRADRRGQGIGSLLLDALVAYAQEHDLRTLSLEVRASNAPAIALYEKRKFERAGLRKNYYTLPTENALILTLEL